LFLTLLSSTRSNDVGGSGIALDFVFQKCQPFFSLFLFLCFVVHLVIVAIPTIATCGIVLAVVVIIVLKIFLGTLGTNGTLGTIGTIIFSVNDILLEVCFFVTGLLSHL
jgi:hypothetical protein